MKTVLLVTDGWVHPPITARIALRRALGEMQGFTFRRIRSLERLPADLDRYDALVLYFHHKHLSQSALLRLDQYVSAGGGILGVHTATASFKDELAYFKIIGGRFTGHGPVETFTLTPRPGSEVFSGLPAFSVRDELYIHELEPGIEVHFTADHQGEEVPAVWTYHYAQGRVCYGVPGHTTQSLQDPIYQEVLRRGLAWVCGA